MKAYSLSGVLGFFAVCLTACGDGSTDSTKVADSTNTARIDSVKDTLTAMKDSTADMKQDANFAVAAADGGMLEVALGKLAVKKGTTASVKKLGNMMVTDHTKANNELKTLAAKNNISIPATMSDKCQKMVSDLTEKKGMDFDKAYADMMVKDHKDDIDEFKKEADKGTDSALATWARGKVPVLEHHLQMAEETQKSLEK